MKKTLDAIRRLWYTGGNGIHSPFAYQLVTQVICCPGAYYVDERLYPMRDRLLHPRRTAVRKLLFRVRCAPPRCSTLTCMPGVGLLGW